MFLGGYLLRKALQKALHEARLHNGDNDGLNSGSSALNAPMIYYYYYYYYYFYYYYSSYYSSSYSYYYYYYDYYYYYYYYYYYSTLYIQVYGCKLQALPTRKRRQYSNETSGGHYIVCSERILYIRDLLDHHHVSIYNLPTKSRENGSRLFLGCCWAAPDLLWTAAAPNRHPYKTY
jgi:hypothetical protein